MQKSLRSPTKLFTTKITVLILVGGFVLLTGCGLFPKKPARDHFIGTWVPMTKARILQPGQQLSDFPILTFVKGGTYYEHYEDELLVGTWEIVAVGYRAPTVTPTSRVQFRLQLNYPDGTSFFIVIEGDSQEDTIFEMNVRNVNERGPVGFYERAETGSGLQP